MVKILEEPKDIRLKISDRLHRKIKEVSAVVGKSTDVLMRDFLEESANIVLSGNVIEVDAPIGKLETVQVTTLLDSVQSGGPGFDEANDR